VKQREATRHEGDQEGSN